MANQKKRVKLNEIGRLVNQCNIPKPSDNNSSPIKITDSFGENNIQTLPLSYAEAYFKILFQESPDKDYLIGSLKDGKMSDQNKTLMRSAIVDFMEQTVGKPISFVDEKSGLRRVDDENDSYIDSDSVKHNLIHFSCYNLDKRPPNNKHLSKIRLHGYYLGGTFNVIHVDWFHKRQHKRKRKKRLY